MQNLDLEQLGDAARAEGRPPQRRMLIIVNPYATTMSDRLKHLVVYALQARYEVDAVDTQRKGHAVQLCRDAAREGYDVVCSFGGDGTVNEAANGLVGTGVALTCLPGGATNVYCRLLGIPNDVVDATEHLLRAADAWDPRSVDVGEVNGRVFAFSSGVGLDASVVERVDAHPKLKSRLGAWYFTSSAVSVFLRSYVLRPPRMEVEVDGDVHRGVTAIVQNAHPYTYFKSIPIVMAEGATLQSGDFAGLVLERASVLDMPSVLARAMTQRVRMVQHRRVRSFAGAQRVVVRSADERELPLQVDGDHVGEVREAIYDIRPRALQVLA